MNFLSWTERVCSACLLKTNLHDMNEEDMCKLSYRDKLKTCFNIDVFNEDSSFLCGDCITKLEASFNFLELLKESQSSLKRFAGELKSSGNQEELFVVLQQETMELYNCADVKTDAMVIDERVEVFDKKLGEFTCSICDKSFKRRQYLNQHLRTHTGEKSYKCIYCDKKFLQVSTQKRHIKSHEQPPGSKAERTPFLCTICGKSFPYSNTRHRHMKTHLGIKSHECHVCQRKFNQSTHLNVHMRTHTGERPYICEICGKAFSLNSGLQKHRKYHENS